MARRAGSTRTTESDSVAPKERIAMEFLIFLVVIAAIAGSVVWGRKYFRHEIDRAKRINRANKNK